MWQVFLYIYQWRQISCKCLLLYDCYSIQNGVSNNNEQLTEPLADSLLSNEPSSATTTTNDQVENDSFD
ncbi:unnamed protein product [Rotaria sp. Silwood2]|nr:unnamed protein product [Rotaria sp. Silwood2]CAF4000118.1 unnamed protein product [Rotaria sp. Silwood2]